jgi:predicted phage terminase large subunit-like protein
LRVPLSLQAQAQLELRRRRGQVKNDLFNPDGSPIGIQDYCKVVTPAWNWEWAHLRYIDSVLDRVTSGELKRVIIECPTRIGKTEKVNVRYPAQRLELNPELPIMVMGYNEKFARRLSRKIYKIVSPRLQMSNRTAADDWETAAGGGIRAAGVGVGIAGLPAGLILIDDPTKNREDAYSQAHRDKVWEWYTEDVYTRLEPDGAIVITMARRHEDDLVGRILASEDAAEWTVIRLPALAEEDDPLGRPVGAALCPERFDEEAYARMRRVIGEVSFSALQQQRPTPASGLIFQMDQIRYYTTPEHPIKNPDGTLVPTLQLAGRWDDFFQSWDMSYKDNSTSDFVSGQVWGRRGVDAYCVDRVNKRMAFIESVSAVKTMTVKWPKAHLKLVEDKANGPAIISSLRSEVTGLVPITPEGDKVSRAWAVTPLFEGGNVWFPHPQIAPWVKAVVLQMVQFPFGANDDDVDSLTQALRRIQKKIEIELKRRKFAARRQPTTTLQLMKM